MSNIYEALQQARRERHVPQAEKKRDVSAERVKSIGTQKRSMADLPPQKPPKALASEQEMVNLYQHICHLLPDSPRKCIQFIASVEGEGVSTIVREFAKVLVDKLDKTVLILDAAHRRPTQHLFFDISHQYGWRNALEESKSIEEALYRAGGTNLFLSPISPAPTLSSLVYNSLDTGRFIEDLKQRFDLILIDSSSATASPDCMAIARCVDGVIMVVEADKTRWQVAENVKNRIANNGGNVLGVVLNKRRFHIPKFFYQHL